MTDSNHILLVDDEEWNRDMLSRRLRHSGFRVGVAADGPSALQYVSTHQPDLVLLDNMMPGMTGIEVLEALRASFSPDRLPVIMVTAMRESENVVEALNMGANDYITKPVDLPVALARINGQLANRAASTRLRQSEERYALAARGSNDGLWDWDLATGRVYYCDRWKAMLGYPEGGIGDTVEEWLARVHPEDVEQLQDTLRTEQAGGSGQAFECEHRMRHRDGSYRWMRSRGAVVQDSAGRPLRMAGSMSDITGSKVFDALTGLPNRIQFADRLEQEFRRFQSDPAAHFAVIFLDIDRFKLINESLGHPAGDQLLAAVAERLLRGVRTCDSLRSSRDLTARVDGDEFAILLCDLADPAQALQVAQRILTALREPFALAGCGIFCTVSVGIAPCGPAYQAPAEVMRDAETAMYAAKKKGRSRCEVFDGPMREQVVQRLQLENDLRRAIENQDFAVHYQPKVRLSDGRICGFEALARWHHPVRGYVPPAEFIPLAEEMGVIHPLDMWVLRQACLQTKEWQAKYPSDPPLAISVNLSPRQLTEPKLAAQIAQVLQETGLEPSCLRLEITEGVFMKDHAAALAVLTSLKSLGIGLKIDDFGTGYSSLAYLAHLPFDTLKVDRSFTEQLRSGESNVEIVKAVLDMAHTLGMEVIAEGVEHREQITRLVSMGCEFGQGYFFSKPVAAQDAGCLLAAEPYRNRASSAVPLSLPRVENTCGL